MGRLTLEDFTSHAPPTSMAGHALMQATMPEGQSEEQRLAAYEEGYKAGWDDATKAEADSQARISADFSQNLQEMSFAFHEARTHVMSAVEPLLREMVEKVLPALAHESLGQHVLELLNQRTEDLAAQPVEIVTATENVAALKTLIGENCTLPHKVIDEPSLGGGQVYVRFAEREEKIDLSAVIDGMDGALSAFSEDIRKGELNG